MYRLPFAKFAFLIAIMAILGCQSQSDTSVPDVKIDSAESPSKPTSTAETSPSARVKGDPDHPVVEIRTTFGVMTVRLDAVDAPGTVRNFLNYVNSGHYDQTIFHYVLEDTMIIGGGYTVDGQEKTVSMRIRNEAHNGRKNVRGTIAMIRDQDRIDSAAAQFFFNLADAPDLDHRGNSPEEYGYCVFGEVIDGIDIAERIANVATKPSSFDGKEIDAPAEPIVIETIRVVN